MKKRKSIRLKGYDYTNPGWYFVTICTKNHVHHFGKIKNDRMILNQEGEIVEEKWKWLSENFKYCDLDEFVVMPNHFHGILIIDPDNIRSVRTIRELSLQQKHIKIKSLSELVGALKTKSSKEIHKQGNINFKWQRSFYDRIIRKEKELFIIRNYIRQNPLRWELKRGIENIDL